MKQTQTLHLLVATFSLFFLCSCGFVELSGKMTKVTGEAMTDYGKENDGFIGTMAGVGGKINTAVGSTVEDLAQKDESSNSEKSKIERFKEANSEVINSAIDSVKEDETTDRNVVLHAQKRLQSLGYDPGPADGIIGNKTRLAIGKYQQSENLEVTNSLNKSTLNALNISSDN